MRNLIIFIFFIYTSFALSAQTVNTMEELHKAVMVAQPGDQIVMANGTWENAEILFEGAGTQEKPITLRAQEKGKVVLTGKSNLRIAGQYLQVEGIVFKNGASPTSELISFKKDSKNLAKNCRLTEVVIDNFNGSERYDGEAWVVLYGKNNRVDHCSFLNKRNKGVTLIVRLNSTESIENNHQIDHNYFGPRQNLGSNGGETLRIGTSHHCMENSQSVVAYNFFDRCNGEVEIISNKSGQNIYRFNTFFECQGTLTMRHGNETLVESNIFIGNEVPNTGGIRVINEKQTIRNNYLEGLMGNRFRGALTVMNGVPNSPLNRYVPVTKSTIANNTLINCSHIELAAGSDEERSVAPKSTTISSNILYSEMANVFSVYDDISGINFSDNCISKLSQAPAREGFKKASLKFNRNKEGLLIPQGTQKGSGSSLEKIAATKENTGATYYAKKNQEIALNSGKQVTVNPGLNSLFNAVKNAAAGDILVLAPGSYALTKVVPVNFPLTIKSASDKAIILFETSALFQLNNGGSLQLSNLKIDGRNAPDSPLNSVIATSKYSMNRNYKLFINNCDFSDLDVNNSFNVLRVAKSTFADTISLTNSSFLSVSGAVLALNQEYDDIGIYNAETVLVRNCSFKDISGAALELYRGGRDESTTSGNLTVDHCYFENVGHSFKNKSKAVMSIWGIQNVDIKNSVFSNTATFNFVLTVGEPINSLHHNSIEKSQVINVKGDTFQSFDNSNGKDLEKLGDDDKKIGLL